MDVFQVLTLCSLLGVMFVGVLGYGMYRNWQRDQLELIRAPSVNPDISSVSDTTGRIYPNIRVDSNPKPKRVSTPIVKAVESPIQTDNKGDSLSDPKGIEDGKSTEDAETNVLSKESQEMKPDIEYTNSEITESKQPRNGSTLSKIEPRLVRETKEKSLDSESPQGEEDGLDLFTQTASPSNKKNGKQSGKAKFLKVKSSSRLERKPPQASKRRKSKAETSSKGTSRDSSPSRDTSGDTGEDFVMFFVLGELDNSFRMSEVGQFLLARGLVLDEMGLFCRKDRESSEVLFKVGDVFFPGTFEAEDLEQYRTGGISLAMKIPNVNNAQVVFEQMLTLANECAERFQGTVKDENYNSMSNQTLAHYRSRVSDFRRKQLTMYA